MKQRFGVFFLICATLFLCAQERGVLVLSGGRMWATSQLTKALKQTGCAPLKVLDSTELAGFGGVSTKHFASDPVEPPKADGITPEFAQLDKYAVLMFNNIPADLLEKMLTDDRIRKLREFVSNGGALILNAKSPETLGDLLPVKFTGPLSTPKAGHQVVRPELPLFAGIPAKWDKLAAYRPAILAEGAELLAPVQNEDGSFHAVALARKTYGKGQVWFYNGDWVRYSNIKQFWEWAYSRAFLSAMIATAGDLKNMDPSKVIAIPPAPPARKKHDALTYDYAPSPTSLQRDGKLTQNAKGSNIIQAPGGLQLLIREDGHVTLRLEKGSVTLQKFELPAIKSAGGTQVNNGSDNEAIVLKYNLKNYKCTWKMRGFQLNDGVLEIRYDGNNGEELLWRFKAGKLILDGRTYWGVAHQAILPKLPVPLESLQFNTNVPVCRIRRMCTYSRPRGYLEGEISNNAIKEIPAWNYFCHGQPFTYYTIPQGVMLEFADTPISCYSQFRAFKTTTQTVGHNLRLLAGNRLAPIELPYLWHFFSAGEERGCNDWMAVYQFLRLEYRSQFGIKTFPMHTMADCYHSMRNEKTFRRVLQTARDLGFESMKLNRCPSTMASVNDDNCQNTLKLVRSYGLIPNPWTPGGYCQGKFEQVVVDHPEWFVRNANGTFYLYGKDLPVADWNNKDFRAWYKSVMDTAFLDGKDEVYMDMMGQAACNVNYQPIGEPCALDGVIASVKYWSDRNIGVCFEGMNPVARDQYLYKPELYAEMNGREFAFVGAQPLHWKEGSFYLDYFRRAMYNSGVNVFLDGYVCNFETLPNEIELINHCAKLNPVINKAHAHVPVPFVRETPFGTAWYGENTGALFFYDSVKKLTVNLPKGWEIEGQQSNVIHDIAPETVLFLRKK